MQILSQQRCKGRLLGRRGCCGGLLLAAGLAVLSGCEREVPASALHYRAQPVQAELKTRYIFSVHPLHNPLLLHRKFEPLMAYLAQQIPNTVFELETSNDYAHYESKLRAGRAHFSLPNPYHATLARDWGYHIVAKMGDDELFRGIFIVRRDSPIKVPTDLRGKVVAYPAPTALAAAMLPQLFLQKNGLQVQTELQNHYVGTHNSAIMNAYLSQSAISATWPPAWHAFQESNPKEAAELRVIWQTPTLIQNAIIARNDVPPAVVEQVTRLLLTLQQSAPGQKILQNLGTSSFVAANDADFEVVRTFIKEFNRLVKKQK